VTTDVARSHGRISRSMNGAEKERVNHRFGETVRLGKMRCAKETPIGRLSLPELPKPSSRPGHENQERGKGGERCEKKNRSSVGTFPSYVGNGNDKTNGIVPSQHSFFVTPRTNGYILAGRLSDESHKVTVGRVTRFSQARSPTTISLAATGAPPLGFHSVGPAQLAMG